jgi:hypothetical protein
MNIRNILVPLFILAVFCCSNVQNGDENDGIGNFDISPDDKKVLFSFSLHGVSSLYIVYVEDGKVKPILKSDGITSYENPKYSPDGENIVFVKYKKGDFEKSTLCIAKNDGTKIEKLTEETEIITEAIFSNNKKDIIFCKAKEYAKHSPLGIVSAHNFDIYSINRFTKHIAKLSNIDAYGIHSVSEVDTSFVLFRVDAGNEGGIYSLEKTNPSVLKRIVPLNDPRKDGSMYDDPVYLQNGILVFTAPYELYAMDLEKRIANLIYDSKGASQITSIRMFKTQQRVLFKKETEHGVLQSIGLDGKNLKAINIDIN